MKEHKHRYVRDLDRTTMKIMEGKTCMICGEPKLIENAAASADCAPASGSVQYRQVTINLEIHGSAAQANSVRDAVGLAADDEWLSEIITPMVHSEEIKAVTWTVNGEQWVPNALNADIMRGAADNQE